MISGQYLNFHFFYEGCFILSDTTPITQKIVELGGFSPLDCIDLTLGSLHANLHHAVLQTICSNNGIFVGCFD
jgi:hypothetical protein